MLYMVIERFKNRDAIPAYRRFREKGRMMPEGLQYAGSWVETNFDRCFQLMECADAKLLEEWAARWKDLVDLSLCPCAGRRKRRKFSRRNSKLRVARTVLHPAKPPKQRREIGAVLLAERGKFHSRPCPGSSMAHNRVRADLALGHKKIKPSDRAGRLRQRRLDEHSAQAHVADGREIVAPLALPVHPHIARSLHARRESSRRDFAGLHRRAPIVWS